MAKTKKTLLELYPYIVGEQYLPEVVVPRCNERLITDFATYLEADPIAKEFFGIYERAEDFFTCCPDAAHLIPKEYSAECFYAARNDNTFYENVPAFAEYVIRRAVELSEGIYNLIPLLLPLNVLNLCISKNYFLGCTLCDVINDRVSGEYIPFKDGRLKVRHSDYTELYIQSKDMVAAVPNKIGDRLDDDSIRRIVQGVNGLEIDGHLLRTMSDYVGAINSVYDLRKLL